MASATGLNDKEEVSSELSPELSSALAFNVGESSKLYKNAPNKFVGLDGSKMAEISDDKSTWEPKAKYRSDYLENILKHPLLYKDNPELRKLKTFIDDLPEGVHSETDLDKDGNVIGLRVSANDTPEQQHHWVMHEVSHMQDRKYGFNKGDRYNNFNIHTMAGYTAYYNSDEERTARDEANRLHLNDAQRKVKERTPSSDTLPPYKNVFQKLYEGVTGK